MQSRKCKCCTPKRSLDNAKADARQSRAPLLDSPETFLSREKWARRKHRPEAVRIIRN